MPDLNAENRPLRPNYFERTLPKHLENVVDIARRNGAGSPSAKYMADTFFIGWVPGANQADIAILHRYLADPKFPVGTLLETLAVLNTIGCDKDTRADPRSLSFIRECFAVVLRSRSEILVQCACEDWAETDRELTEQSKTRVPASLDASLRRGDGIERYLDVREPGVTRRLSRDAIGVLEPRSGTLRAVVVHDRNVPREGPGIDPRPIDDLARYIGVEYPELRWLQHEYKNSSPGIERAISSRDLIREIDIHVARPVAGFRGCSRLDIFEELWPDAESNLFDRALATPGRPAERHEDDAVGMQQYIDDFNLSAAEQQGRSWHNVHSARDVQNLFVLPGGQASFDEYRRALNDVKRKEFKSEEPVPLTERWYIKELGVSLPLAGVADKLARIASDIRTSMVQPRYVVSAERLTTLPSFVPYRDRIPAGTLQLFRYLPALVPKVELILGAALEELPFRAWAHLLLALSTEDHREWSRVREAIAAHPRCTNLILESFFACAESPDFADVVLDLTGHLDTENLEKALSTYCELLATVEVLEGRYFPSMSLEDRLEWREVSQAALSGSNRCLKAMLGTASRHGLGSAAPLDALSFYKGEVNLAAALYSVGRDSRTPHAEALKLELRDISPADLSGADRAAMRIIAETACLAYPEPLRTLSIAGFNTHLDSATTGVFHMLYHGGHVVAFVHVEPRTADSVYGRGLYARTEAQRSGIGTDFIIEVTNRYTSRQIAFDAVVWKDHPMWSVYRDVVGFRMTGESDRIFPESGYRFFTIRKDPFPAQWDPKLGIHVT